MEEVNHEERGCTLPKHYWDSLNTCLPFSFPMHCRTIPPASTDVSAFTLSPSFPPKRNCHPDGTPKTYHAILKQKARCSIRDICLQLEQKEKAHCLLIGGHRFLEQQQMRTGSSVWLWNGNIYMQTLHILSVNNGLYREWCIIDPIMLFFK